jgi:DhnA family fructose-bisphosphate aldolase class Ia
MSSDTKTIHIISDEAWTLSEGEKNVLQVAMDHMVEHLEDLVHDHPTSEQYKRRLVDARMLQIMVQPW